ncbi:MAG: YceI family protein [Flavobacteriales bacterium]|nr:YceI family protein [Flavobacteriales bacterium]
MKEILISVFMCAALSASAQKIYTKNGQIDFYSDAPMEKIEATNTKATSVVDLASGAMQWSVLIKAFHFEKALMEEHFNENYMESSKFPKATFKGALDNLEEIDFSADGTYIAQISGDLNVHGVTKPIKTQGTFEVKEGKISGSTEFSIAVADFEIEIPSIVKENIAKDVRIIVKADYLQLEQ